MRKIDLWLLDNVFQKIADFICDLTKLNCFDQAKIFLLLSNVFDYFAGVPIWILLIVAVTNLICISTWQNLYRKKFQNFGRVALSGLRLMLWTIYILAFINPHFILSILSQTCFVAVYYLISCNINPPKEKEVFSWNLGLS